MPISLAGRVVEERTALGQNGLTVQAFLTGQSSPTSTTTTMNDTNGEAGYWSFSGLADGTYEVAVLCPYKVHRIYGPSQVQFNQITLGAGNATIDSNGNATLQNLTVPGGSTGVRVGGYSGTFQSSTGLGVFGNSEFQNSLQVDLNLLVGGNSVGGGRVVIFLANASTIPTSNPSGGGILYVSSGSLVYKGSSGTVTTLASA